MTQDSQKLFGRYHELVLLLLGFALTTVLGGYLAYTWQVRTQTFQRESEHRRMEQQAATQLFEELSRLMDKRLYRMRRLHTGLADPKAANDMRTRWETYRSSVFEWNENLNRNRALTQRYFGDDARKILEREINERFRLFGALLEGNSYPPGVSDRFAHRQKVADDLNNVIYDIDVRMIEAIQRGDVGQFRVVAK